MSYIIRYSSNFKKAYKRCKKRGLDMLLLKEVIRILSEEGKLPPTYHAHTLQGKYKDLWECHIQPDWLLVWEQNDKEFILYFLSTGTHSDLFKK
ncbi:MULTISPECIES: type II toxin-antitoxin system YafQ family toxin [Prevotellaceae]|jgi:addiction module toxin, relE/stbE family|nr:MULTISPECIES: type II toxin-antitoxin system YafQ family toxin [Prevotellaceae]MBF1448370.1 type II toxin-antitoxin system YafQ family toxin [Segatella oris]OFO73219.1 addiction module toxin RelE [Prevotella sp. HMSC077E08]OFP57746.1 addiction module toxin RelE [Prevotella sp. HMSC077E09]